VSGSDAIGVAHGGEEYNGYRDDPKQSHAGASFNAAGVRLMIGCIPTRLHSDSLYSRSEERVSAYVVA
jgi:hypothetical protein